jgi:hypothetical protein
MDPQHVDKGNPTAHWLDTLARTVAGGGHSRRAFLGRTGTGLGEAVLALLTPRWLAAATACAEAGQSCNKRACCRDLTCIPGVQICCLKNQVCGNACCPSGSRCLTGGGKPRCVCDATSCPSGCCQGATCQPGTTAQACGSGGAACQACTGGTSCCAGSCVNLQTNPDNCGACGHICPPGQPCVNGACQCAATAPNFCASTNTCLAACPAGTSFNPSTCQCEAAGICPQGGLTCSGDFTPFVCGATGPQGLCLCTRRAEGDVACVEVQGCPGQSCTTTADCPSGQICVVGCCPTEIFACHNPCGTTAPPL